MKEHERKTGVLLHITSLPSQYGVGDMGDEAYRFIDTISSSGIKIWQILPTGPTGFGDSPYASRSAFAGNELFISPRSLYIDGYLDIDDVLVKAPESDRVDYGKAKEIKMLQLSFHQQIKRKRANIRHSGRREDGGWRIMLSSRRFVHVLVTQDGFPNGPKNSERGMTRL